MTVRAFETAMILGAGLGQRMRPLTSVLPKPALPMPDGPVVASALRLAASAGATRIVVNVSHLADKMAEAVSEVTIGGVEIALSCEDELMGTAGGLAVARDRGLLGNEGSVLVINGDGALGLNLKGFAEHHLAHSELVTLALLPHLDPERWSRVVLDVDERVKPGEIPVALWQPAQRERRLGGLVVAGHWREVGSPTDYLEVMLLRLAGTTWIHPSASVAAGASIRNSFIGRGAVVSDRAVIEESVVAEGVCIGEGARLTRSVLFGAVEIAPDQNVVKEIRATAR
jgi:NDP-sugar pyrophosphorylase family protein